MTTDKEKQAENGKAAREVRVVVDTSVNANLLDTARFEHAQRIATAIAWSPLIPEHLRRNKHREFSPQEVTANVLLVINQALIWDVNPQAILGETYVVGGRLGYQGKLVAALINAKANLVERLSKTFEGKQGTDDFTIVISGTFRGESTPRETRMSVGEAKTENQMWKKNPRLKLWYSGVVQWAREYAPELILGIVTDDDAERMEVWQKESGTPRQISSDVRQVGPAKSTKPIFTAEEPKAAPKRVKKPLSPIEHNEPEVTEKVEGEAVPPPVVEGEEFPWDTQEGEQR
jgi:hypothetical protein